MDSRENDPSNCNHVRYDGGHCDCVGEVVDGEIAGDGNDDVGDGEQCR